MIPNPPISVTGSIVKAREKSDITIDVLVQWKIIFDSTSEEEWVASGDSGDEHSLVEEDKEPKFSSLDQIKPGDFRFTKFQSCGKGTSAVVRPNYGYISFVSKILPNNELEVNSLKSGDVKKKVSEEMTKIELMEYVKMYKPSRVTYEIDSIAASHSHIVIRLPPYHCHFNPIKLIWAQVKRYVSDKNTTFRLTDMEHLVRQGIELMTAEKYCGTYVENYVAGKGS
ncbi:hypothetical protein C0J52_22849 [Blattella germanica]|nr:hypothetical protein C0J52_22849 [Blattella germanica]